MRFIVLESPMTALLDWSPMYFFSPILPLQSATVTLDLSAATADHSPAPGGYT